MNQNNEDYFISPNFQFNDDYNPFQINFQEENYSFIKEIDDDYCISAKQNSFDEKMIPFKEKEKEIIYQDDKLNFEGSNYLAASPLKKEQNILDKVQEISFFDIGSTKTKVSAKMLGHKTKRDNNKIYEDLKIQFNEAIKITKNDNIFLGKTKNVLINEWNKRTFGRKRKSELDKGEHNKHSEDNMMRKIKTFFLNYCHNLLNKSIKNKDLQFLKLNSNISENLKKDFNLKLLNTTLRDLYYNSTISTKYKKKIFSSYDANKLIIQKIYKDKEEIETIKILNLTYKELLQVLTRNIRYINFELEKKIEGISILEDNEFKNINKFFNEIKNQEIKKNESKEVIDDYLNNIKDLCLNYEEWYLNKRGRNRTKKYIE